MQDFLAFLFCLLTTIQCFGQSMPPAAKRPVDSLIDVSRELTNKRQFEEALRIGETAQKIAVDTFGPASAEYAAALFNLGRVYHISEQFEQAKPFYLKAKEIRLAVLGSEHPDYARNLINLALLYGALAQYELAEPLYLEAIAILKKKLDTAPVDYTRCLNNLAILYTYTGRYEEAEPLYVESKTIRKKILGDQSPDYASSLSNLAALYYTMGQYKLAKPLYLEAKTIREHTLGKENPDYAASLDNLAILYYSLGEYNAAKPLYMEAKAIREHTLGKEHTDYASTLNNLGLLYTEMERFDSAEALFLEAGAIWEKVSGPVHPNAAEYRTNLAVLYQQMHRYDRAESLYLEAKAIWAKTLGVEHPGYIRCLNKLAELYREMHRFDAAGSLYLEAKSSTNGLLSRASRFLTDRELSSYVRLFSNDLDQYYAFARISGGSVPGFAAGCYDEALFYKGFLLNVSCRINNLAGSDTVAGRMNNLLKSYRRRLAREYAKPVNERSAGLADLEAEANTLEKELVRTVAGFGEAIRQVSWQDVQAGLKPGEAAIEFIRYHITGRNTADSTEYAAIVLRSKDAGTVRESVEPILVPLFGERQLERLLPQSNDVDQIEAFYQGKTGKAVYELIWQPIERLLAGVSTVYCSPTGLLHRINLGAIPVSSQMIYADRFRLVLLGSTRQIINQTAGRQSGEASAMLFGGINYDSPAKSGKPRTTSGSRGRGARKWKYLPATASEVKSISLLLRKNAYRAQIRIGSDGTEEAFKQLGHAGPSPRILHLATHGYVFPDPKEDNQPRKGILAADPVFKSSDHPMIRSGLILAGANKAWTGNAAVVQGEDGILTAYEISQQNLSNTEVAVLSACETGLGQIEGNEGVYGLQRAFKIAGVKYLLMSLWQVNDLKTSELMTEFYRQFLERKLPVHEAFRAAQRVMRLRYPESPYVWAGFVLVE